MIFAYAWLFVSLLGVSAFSTEQELHEIQEKPFLEPGNVYDAQLFHSTIPKKNDDDIALDKRLLKELEELDGTDKDQDYFDQPEPFDIIPMEKRIYINRQGFRPAKRSMAIGRAGMRPGKRAFAPNWNGGKRLASFSDNYYPLDRFSYFDE